MKIIKKPTASLPEHSLSLKARKEYIEVEPNVRLHITHAGEGRPIVLIPGWPFSDEMFEYQYKDLINNNFRVIGITLRGFGKSDRPYGAYNYDVFALDIKKVLNFLEIENAVLGGFSMGGAVAIRFVASDHGAHFSKLALFGAAAPLWTQRLDFPYNLTIKAVNELIELNNHDRPMLMTQFGRLLSATETTLNNGIMDWLQGLGLNASSHATAESLIALRDTDLRADLAKISIPTLIMHGKKDKICSFDLAEQMHAGIRDSKIIPFENSGHSLCLEETEKFNEELIKFSKS